MPNKMKIHELCYRVLNNPESKTRTFDTPAGFTKARLQEAAANAAEHFYLCCGGYKTTFPIYIELSFPPLDSVPGRVIGTFKAGLQQPALFTARGIDPATIGPMENIEP